MRRWNPISQDLLRAIYSLSNVKVYHNIFEGLEAKEHYLLFYSVALKTVLLSPLSFKVA